VGKRGTPSVDEISSSFGMDSTAYAESLDQLFPGAMDEAHFLDFMCQVGPLPFSNSSMPLRDVSPRLAC